MRDSLLNLISAPVPVLNSLGLRLRVGLSSEDPMVTRHLSESYQSYLSIYSPEGLLVERVSLGEIPPHRRKLIDVNAVAGKIIPNQDHLVVVHRVPSHLAGQVSSLEDEIELTQEPDYSYFRSLVEYSYPEGGNGSVIYETPPRLNAGSSSNTLTFTNQVVLSEFVNTYLALINYSVDSLYSRIVKYRYGVYSLSGERLVSGSVDIGPFSFGLLDMKEIIPDRLIQREQDPEDRLSTFNFVGVSENGALLVVAVNAAPALGAVAVEHTHPSQTYMVPIDPSVSRRAKTEAQVQWRSILAQDSGA